LFIVALQFMNNIPSYYIRLGNVLKTFSFSPPRYFVNGLASFA